MRRALILVLAIFIGLAFTYSGQCETKCALNGPPLENRVVAVVDPMIPASMDPSADHTTCHSRNSDKSTPERNLPRCCMIAFYPQNQAQMQAPAKNHNVLVIAAVTSAATPLFSGTRLLLDHSPPAFHPTGPLRESVPLRI